MLGWEETVLDLSWEWKGETENQQKEVCLQESRKGPPRGTGGA